MMLDFALLVLRLFVGLLIAAHGAQKVFGWFGGGGIPGTQRMVRSLGVHPSIFWTWVSALNELIGGLLTALGLLMPLGPLMILANMLFAVFHVHIGKGFWNTQGGVEFPLLILVTAVALGFADGGRYTLDTFIGFTLPEPAAMIIGMVIVVIGYFGSQITSRAIAIRREAHGHHS
jgi:putative oxidoreductase